MQIAGARRSDIPKKEPTNIELNVSQKAMDFMNQIAENKEYFPNGNPMKRVAGSKIEQDEINHDREIFRQMYGTTAQAIFTKEKEAEKQKEEVKIQQKAAEIGDQIIAGRVPPEIPRNLYKIAPDIQTYLASKDFDQVTAQADWFATKKYVNSLNSTQQVRLKQAVTFTKDSLDIIENLAGEWKAGKFAPLNAAELFLAEQGGMGKKAQSIATRLNAQISDLTSELGTVYKGGNSSTDESLKLAALNLKGKWEESVLIDNINQIRKNLEIRERSIKHTPIGGLSVDSKYKRLDQSTQETKTETSSLATPKTGEVIKGYKFKGGDPADKNNWEKQ
jgi:hypothetical protein